jgi:starch phosphorylase
VTIEQQWKFTMATNDQTRAEAAPGGKHSRTGLGVETLKRAIIDNLFYAQGRFPDVAKPIHWYNALAYTVRDRLLYRWLKTAQTFKNTRARTVCYLSAEYLLGPHLANNLVNLGIEEEFRQACSELGLDFDEISGQEKEAGLGNGGLGRLAACYMDSLASLQIPAIGYGIRYEFGIFDQELREGWQAEITDRWLHGGNPWEVPRPDIAFEVKLGGYTEHFIDDAGGQQVTWIADRVVKGVAYDTPLLGYRVNNANLLRLWAAEARESFDFQAFNTGDYYQAVAQKVASENLTKVLYPNDEPEAGKQLRLEQQYFFVSCSLRDMIRIYLQSEDRLDNFAAKYTIQLNDTHPSIAVAELMRVFLDENGMAWETAWEMTRKTMGYTNHTLLPEALEKWPLALFEQVLPRHLEIIYEINRRFLEEVRSQYPDEQDLIARVSLIDEEGERYVRMANLAAVGSHTINGVAALHTRLLEESVMADFYRLMPEKFSNKTNGVTPRRFMRLCNPGMSALISEALGGEHWLKDLDALAGLETLVHDAAFIENWRAVKRANKVQLAEIIKRQSGIVADPDSMFDVQVKRIHEYKRQHLNVLHILTLYSHMRRDPDIDVTPRTFIFGGKAAPGYYLAKLMIKLITSVAHVVNNDPLVRGRLKVVFYPNYNVTSAQRIYPAADLSEQISMAGKEASGTGNMKLSLNGALTIGTLDGANVEIREAVGPDNFFLFGLKADEATAIKAGGYRPRETYHNNHHLRMVIDELTSGVYSQGDPALFKPIVDTLLDCDEYLLLADYQSYIDAQHNAGHSYKDGNEWARKSILNVARMGRFSSDRSIREYCRDIWCVEPLPIEFDRPFESDVVESLMRTAL